MLVKPLATSLSVALFPGVIDCDVVEPLPPLNGGGSDLNSSSSGYARLGRGVAPPLGVAEKEVAGLIALVRWVPFGGQEPGPQVNSASAPACPALFLKCRSGLLVCG